MVHAKLADEHLGVLGCREHRERKADEVVEVPGGGVHARGGGDACTQHVLGGRLAHGARDAHDGPRGMADAPLPRKTQQELLAVVILGAQHGTATRPRGDKHVGRHVGTRHDGTGTSPDGTGEIGVAVKALATEGDEDRTRLDQTGIDDDLSLDRERRGDENLRARCQGQLLCGKADHAPSVMVDVAGGMFRSVTVSDMMVAKSGAAESFARWATPLRPT